MQLTTFPLFMRAKFGDEHNWKKAVARDVQFKVILYSRTNEKSKLDLNPVLEKSDHYEIRWTSAFIPACMLLIDGKEAFYRIGHDVNCPVLWSTSPQFVALSKDYFKMKCGNTRKNRAARRSPDNSPTVSPIFTLPRLRHVHKIHRLPSKMGLNAH